MREKSDLETHYKIKAKIMGRKSRTNGLNKAEKCAKKAIGKPMQSNCNKYWAAKKQKNAEKTGGQTMQTKRQKGVQKAELMGERSEQNTRPKQQLTAVQKKNMQQHMHKHMQQLEFGATHIQNARKAQNTCKKGFNAAAGGRWCLISSLLLAACC